MFLLNKRRVCAPGIRNEFIIYALVVSKSDLKIIKITLTVNRPQVVKLCYVYFLNIKKNKLSLGLSISLHCILIY